MKNKKIVILLLFTLFLTTGCGSSNYLKENKTIITNEETGQSLQNNILCKPTEESLYNTYLEYNDQLKVKLEDLPECSEFKPSDIKYNSLWESIFVKPLAFIILRLGNLIKNYGVSVMLIGIIIRLVLMPFSKKSLEQSENMKKATPELQKIERKYANKTDSDSMMMKSQETMLVYKKYKISPISGCLLAFIQLPLFFAFLQAINRVPAIFEDSLFGMKLGMTPWVGIINNRNYFYLLLVILIGITTYLSFKNSMKQTAANSEMQNQMQFSMLFMILMISLASLSLPTAIALYWIVTNGFVVFQNFIFQKISENKKKR
jgi:YidC/Oxa1 family membrane protein insertase